MPSNKYKNIFFDLDRTLWDYRSNSELTLSDLINKYIPELNFRFDEFLKLFYETNDALWLKYRDGIITKDVLSNTRFIKTFGKMGVNAESFAHKFGLDYVKEAPYKTKLFPYTTETLEYLKNKGYSLYLLTNGFVEVQKVKVRESKLESFFIKMITSEEVGYQKPNRKIFECALDIAKGEKRTSLMIGDDLESDIFGAKSFGMDTVFFNRTNIKHNSEPTFEISRLDELKLFL